ncbi:hypothetical protein MCEMSEM23_00824 [Rhabdaerophilaceae bacterium]
MLGRLTSFSWERIAQVILAVTLPFSNLEKIFVFALCGTRLNGHDCCMRAQSPASGEDRWYEARFVEVWP